MNKVIVKQNGWLEAEIELDAILVLCGMKGGMDAIMAFGLRHTYLFPTTKNLTDRCFALKTQPEMYVQAVSEKAAELEKHFTSIISLMAWQPKSILAASETA